MFYMYYSVMSLFSFQIKYKTKNRSSTEYCYFKIGLLIFIMSELITNLIWKILMYITYIEILNHHNSSFNQALSEYIKSKLSVL